MNTLSNRLYYELSEWKYAELTLKSYFSIQTKMHKYLDFVLTLISIVGIVGWFRYPEFKYLWPGILIVAQAIRLSKKMIMTSIEDLYLMKASIDFYNYHLRDLENIFYDYYDLKYNDKTIEKTMRNLQDKERGIFKSQSFGLIKLSQAAQAKVESEADNYLNKLKTIINVDNN